MSPRIRIVLLSCLWLAFLLRVWGLDFGLPYEFHPDEHQYVGAALTWYTEGQLDLSFINPPLFIYTLLIAYWPWLGLVDFEPSPESIPGIYFFARLWSVAFSLLTVALAYPLGKRLYNQKAGVLAVVLLSGLFLPAREAHFAVNDTAAAFFALLVIYFSLSLLRRRWLATYLWVGITVGMAAAAKLTAGGVVTTLIAAHLLADDDQAGSPAQKLLKKLGHHYLLLSLGLAAGTYALISAPLLWELSNFVETIARHLQFGTEGYKDLKMTPATGWEFYLGVLGWGLGWPLLLVTLGVLFLVFWKGDRPGIVMAVFPIVLFSFMGGQKIVFARFLLPAIPPLVVLAAFGLIWMVQRFRFLQQFRQLTYLLGLMILLGQPLIYLVWFNYLLTLPDTRQLATDWLMENFPKDTVIVKESYSVLPAMLSLNNHWPYKVIHLDERGPTRNQVDHYLMHKTEIIALSNFTAGRIRQDPAEEAARLKQLALLEEKAVLIKTFNPYRHFDDGSWFYLDQLYGPAAETLKRIYPGPLIKIYRLPYDSQPYQLAMPDISVPVKAIFDGKLMLLGYDLPTRRAQPGEGFPLTLYWQAESQMRENYVIFSRLLDREQQSWGGYDRWPQETAKTSLWHPGEVVIDTFNLPVSVDAPDGVYTLDIGLYDQADPMAAPLPILQAGHPTGQNSVRIGPVKVGGGPSGTILSSDQINPQISLSTTLGQPPLIRLHGYDLIQEKELVELALYWESLAQTNVDWSVFVHLRNEAGEIVAQQDGLAGGIQNPYPTSLWEAGEIVTDRFSLSLPAELPPAQYHLVVGLYNLADGMRLPVPGSLNNEINLITLNITDFLDKQ
jgi:hypothetical protein